MFVFGRPIPFTFDHTHSTSLVSKGKGEGQGTLEENHEGKKKGDDNAHCSNGVSRPGMSEATERRDLA